MSTSYTTPELKSKSELRRSSLILPTEFHFWNGDEYTGEFSFNKEKLKFAKEGEGVYKTADGQVYEGTWSDDALTNICQVTYANESVFRGFLEDMMMEGPGKFSYKEGVTIETNFSANYPLGRITLKDPNGHMWGGMAREGEPLIWLRLVHPFWISLLDETFQQESIFYGETDEDTVEETVTTWEDDKLNFANNKFI